MTRLWLPFPPSVNNLFVNNPRTGGRFPSSRYKAWQADALEALLKQPDRFHRHVEPVEVLYAFGRPDKRARDVFNLEKVVSDFLVKRAILADDSLIHRGTVEWGHTPGVTVTIEPLSASNLVNYP
ncbi:RusA family crossover junction endodeoxyribonuclease [Gemmata sp. G18]|uniref:RusA family crossover junction endodeoxyribonuclease n=1 Tax=Gemmata palustris TaxID=2822762 RepID=A0ABS5BP00_9BACT|nr:RusA family crossover junction endodeoxyribonuclease [Gemmata palustris]MBP3955418.1 RusA family crossover junction endodeoxyribonuclease [Gemmata palustris]